MIFVTGDCHGDWRRFSKDIFYEQNEMTRDDYIIVCGDFGIWHDTREERQNLDRLSTLPFTILFCDGNHENFDRLYSNEFEELSWHGGMIHKIRENVFHLERGYVFDIDNKKIFVFGGASSHDIRDGIIYPTDFCSHKEMIETCKRMEANGYQFRINHYSWWREETPSAEEMQRGLDNLSLNNNEVDFIITHCCPQSLAAIIGNYKRDNLTIYFDKIADQTMFKTDKNHTKWFFGHYHDNRQILGDYYLLYEQIIRIN